MFDTTPHDGPSRRTFLKAGALGVGAGLLGVGTTGNVAASDGDDVTRFDDYLEITEPGTYVLTRDLEGPGEIFVRPGTSDVLLDGTGHTVEGLLAIGDPFAQRVNDITVQNFHLPEHGVQLGEAYTTTLYNNVLTDVFAWHSNFDVRRNTFVGRGIVTVEGTTCDVTHNLFADGGVDIDDTEGENRVSANYFANGGISIGGSGTSGVTGIRPERIEDNYVENGGIRTRNVGPISVRRNVCIGSDSAGLSPDGDGPVADNVAFGHAEEGFRIFGGGVLRNNVSSRNGGDGFSLRGGNFDARRNVAAHNEGSGFSVSVDQHSTDVYEHVLQRNVAIGNAGDGMNVTAASRGTIKFNRVAANAGDGLAFSDSDRNEIRHNDATANGGNGLAFYDADRNGVSRNTLCANGGENLFEDDESEANRYANNTIC